MVDVDLNTILTKLSDPAAGANIDKATSFAEKAKTTLDAADGWLKIAERAVNLAERTGALPGLIRALGKQYGVDVDKPLATAPDPLAVSVPTGDHRLMYNFLNSLSAAELHDIAPLIENYMKGKADAKELPVNPGATDSNRDNSVNSSSNGK